MGGDTVEKMPPEAQARDARSGLSHVAIRAQMDRILASPEFHATDKMRDFLRFVVEEKLAGRAHRLKGYTIATEVFCRGDDFDAAHDPIVRIQAGRLRRALERYYLIAGGGDPVVIDMPKGRYVPTFAAQSVTSVATRSGAPREPHVPPVGPSIAVAPLDNLSADPDQSFFAVGLGEDLITELSRFQDIKVVSCHRTPSPAGLPADPVELGRSIGARFVLRGSVRRDSDMVKVSVQLTDARTSRQVWADSYAHPIEANQLIATQETIAQSVVSTIASEYGIIARRLSAESRKKPPAMLDTYEAMLRYYSHQVAPSPESAAACFPTLQRAVDKEPEFGPAWSALATLYCQLYSNDVAGFDSPLETAVRYALQGVSLEPGSQLGRLILAYVSYVADDEKTLYEEIETALALNPNSPYTVGTAGYFHVMRGEFEKGLPLLDRAIAANPCHPSWFHGAYVIDHLRRRNYEHALAELQTYRPFQSFWEPVAHAAILAFLGRFDEARFHVEHVTEAKPDFAARARELLHRTLKIDHLIDDVIDGLRSAGLPVEDGGRPTA